MNTYTDMDNCPKLENARDWISVIVPSRRLIKEQSQLHGQGESRFSRWWSVRMCLEADI